ncbi:MAG: hypothetical protein HQM10_03340 [Candidatus Riflebacteria bacterium]|nr:hypothetical protein [Candidatus Riflebacteria bacterium]
MHLLIINTDKSYSENLKYSLETMGHELDISCDQASGEELFQASKHEMVLIGHEPGQIDSLGLLKKFRAINPDLRVVISWPQADVRFVCEAVHERVFDFFTEKIDFRFLILLLDETEQRIKVESERKEQHSRLAMGYARLKQAYNDLQERLK